MLKIAQVFLGNCLSAHPAVQYTINATNATSVRSKAMEPCNQSTVKT